MNRTLTALSIGALTLATSLAFARPLHLKNFDSDGDGSITRNEVESHAAKQAQAIDSNGDGIITLTEVQADHERRRQERMQKRLNKADTNGDGEVGLDEFSARIVERMMGRDSNGDGVLNADDRPERGAHRPRPGHR